MTALAYNLTQGGGGNAGPKPPASVPVHPSVSGKGKGPSVAPKTATPPNWLAPLNPNQIRQQATKEVQQAYAPAFNELRSQGSRAQAIYDKQVSDNHYYLNWLTTQSAALQAHNDASNQVLQNEITSLTSQSPTSQLPGVGGADAAQLAATAQAGQQYINNTGAQELHTISDNNTALDTATLGNANAVYAGQSRESAALQASLDKLNTVGTDLLSKQAASLTAAIQNAQKTEIAKAEYAQNTAIAENKLGLQTAVDQNLINTRNQSAKTSAFNAQTNRGRLDQTIKQNAAQNAINWARIAQTDQRYNLDVQKYNDSVAKDIYQREHGLGPYKPSAGKSPYLQMASQNVILKRIQSVSGEINSLVSQGMSPQNAYHTVQRGYYVITDSQGKQHKYNVSSVESDPTILNAAFNTRPGGPGLSPGDVSTLQNYGIDPNRLKTILKESPQPGTVTVQPDQWTQTLTQGG